MGGLGRLEWIALMTSDPYCRRVGNARMSARHGDQSHDLYLEAQGQPYHQCLADGSMPFHQ